MDESIKQKWIEALESGQYQQGTGALALEDGKKHCCLGVLCDLYHEETGKGKWYDTKSNTPVQDFSVEGDEGDGVLPNPVKEWAGLSSSVPSVGVTSLTSLNDDGYSFETIASKIEKHL